MQEFHLRPAEDNSRKTEWTVLGGGEKPEDMRLELLLILFALQSYLPLSSISPLYTVKSHMFSGENGVTLPDPRVLRTIWHFPGCPFVSRPMTWEEVYLTIFWLPFNVLPT